jgi:hypothetical protein
MGFLSSIKRSVAAAVMVLVLGLLSMGALGAALYYACYPLFAPVYGDLNDWRGDWVWNAMIWAGMLWSLSFLAAGRLDLRLEGAVSPMARKGLYVALLWLGAVVIWTGLLLTAYEPA